MNREEYANLPQHYHQWRALGFSTKMGRLGGLCLMVLFLILCGTTALYAADAAQESIGVDLTVGIAEGFCADEQVIAVPGRTQIYFCVTITNQSQVALTRHTIAVPQLFPNPAIFTITVPPGEQLAVTTGVLEANGVDVVLDVTVFDTPNPPVNITYTAIITSSGSGIEYSDSATAEVVYGQVALDVRQTVGTDPTTCATKNNIAVANGTTVYYCVDLAKSGDLAITEYTIIAPAIGASLTVTTPLAANPFFIGQATVTAPITSVVTVVGRTAEGVTATDSAIARVVPGTVATELSYTVGIDQNECASATSVTVVPNTTVYYCIKLKNIGTLPLVHHTITSTVQINNGSPQIALATSYTKTVAPGETLQLMRSFDNRLARPITVGETNQLAISSYTKEQIPVTAQASATVSTGNLAFSLGKYARTDDFGCAKTTSLTILTTQNFYYCIVIQNTGQVPFQNFTISEPTYNINFNLNYALGVGQILTLTNSSLVALNLGPRLGPFVATGNINSTMTVIAGTSSGTTTSASQTFSIVAAAPTATLTPIPASTSTPVPTLTFTPIPSPTVPDTPTPTFVALSILPTATDATGLNTIATPPTTPDQTNGVDPAIDGQPASPIETPTPEVNVFETEVAMTLEAANAATATDIAMTEIAITAEASTATTEALLSAATQTANALLPTDTLTPVPTDTPLPPPTETTVAQGAAQIGGSTIGGGGNLPAGNGPASATDDYFRLLITSFATSTVALGWVWFLAGSVIFFAVAGMFAGLTFRQQEAARYQMSDGAPSAEEGLPLFEDWPLVDEIDPENFAATSIDRTDLGQWSTSGSPAPASGADPTDDDFWPTSLR